MKKLLISSAIVALSAGAAYADNFSLLSPQIATINNTNAALATQSQTATTTAVGSVGGLLGLGVAATVQSASQTNTATQNVVNALVNSSFNP